MKGRVWAACFLAAAGCLGAFAAACSSESAATSDAGADASTTSDVIKIGAVFTQSPQGVGLAGVGQQLRDSLLVAQDYINRTLVLRKRVQIIVKDDQNDDTVRERVALQLVEQEKVVAIIGAVGSDQTKSLQKVLKPRNVTLISPTSTSPDLSGNAENPEFLGLNAERTFFRTVANDGLQGLAVALFARQGPAALTDAGAGDGGTGAGCSRLAIIYGDDSYGREIDRVAKQAFEARGGTVVLERAMPASDPGDGWAASSKTIVTDLFNMPLATRPQCQALPMYEVSGAAYQKAFETARAASPTALGADFFSIGTDGLYIDDFLRYARSVPNDPMSPSYAEHNVFGTAPDSQPPTREYETFRTLYLTKFPDQGPEAPPFTANAFDAALLIALGVQAAGDPKDAQKVREGILAVSRGGPSAATYAPDQFAAAIDALGAGKAIKYLGASGSVTFNETGDVESGMVIWHAERKSDGTMGFVTTGRIPATSLR